ncbi:ATP-binding protein [Mucilaginibacter litoreus]|uniref:histidine kinase n=1 Tax=Mucilaginibacter litoreus TaxID=1048221 RepID=A0ABW3AWN7_9SPHI
MFAFLLPKFNYLFDTEIQLLNRARIRIITTLLSLYAALFTCLTIFYFFQERNYLLLRAGTVAAILIANFVLLLKGISWRKIAHSFVCCLTILIWTNILFIHQGVNLVTGQYVVLIVTCGFYLLEERWGLLYSLLNILPLIVYVFSDDYLKIVGSTQFQNQNKTAYHIILIFNFGALLYTHYFFFKEYKNATTKEQLQRKELNEALKAANYTAQEKTNFLATMSHELRTPLNAVIGMANLLLIETHLEEQKENLDVLQFSAENLMSIINDILDFNKIDAGKVEVHPVNFRLDVLVDHLCGTFNAKAEAKGIRFNCVSAEVLAGKTLLGDQTRLIQILFNLVGNAVKFTSDGYVKMKTEALLKKDDHVDVTFLITDTGIGIPEENLAFIYEPYTQSQARTNRQYHGTGLGLTIAKKLVELLGGELHLHTAERVGTSFAFTLPFKIMAEQLPPIRESNKVLKNLSELKVLVAEDNPINVLVIKKILKTWAIEPQIAVNGQHAVESVMSNDFDVVLMDINMPVMDGFEASKTIRELPNPVKAAIPIIAVTASVGASIEHHHGYQYLTDCLLKPFKPEDLHRLLQKFCR